MLWLHQIHQLAPDSRRGFEQLLQKSWQPALASRPGARLAWCGSTTRAAVHGDQIITIVGLADAAALVELSARSRTGDLREVTAGLAGQRTAVETRLLESLDYDPFGVETVEAIPVELQERASTTYMHDFVPPTRGHMVDYEDMMRARYMALTEKELSGVVLRTSWRTIVGGGPVPEMFNLSEIRSTDAFDQLVGNEIPAEYKAMGTWMWEALAVRDRWTTRLVRSATWSPIQ